MHKQIHKNQTHPRRAHCTSYTSALFWLWSQQQEEHSISPQIQHLPKDLMSMPHVQCPLSSSLPLYFPYFLCLSLSLSPSLFLPLSHSPLSLPTRVSECHGTSAPQCQCRAVLAFTLALALA